MRKCTVLIALLISFFCSSASATLIYDNGEPDSLSGANITALRVADDFTLPDAASLAAIRFWAYSEIGDLITAFSGTVTWAVYQDTLGSLGPMVGSATVSGIVPYATGFSVSGLPVYGLNINLAAPLVLAANKYWLELHEGPSLDFNDGIIVSWAASESLSGLGNAKWSVLGAVPITSLGTEQGFQLFNAPLSSPTATPEPATWLFIGGGLAGIGLLRLRRRCARKSS